MCYLKELAELLGVDTQHLDELEKLSSQYKDTKSQFLD